MAKGVMSWVAEKAFRIAFDHRAIVGGMNLPRSIRKLKEKAREFADRELRPRALKYDAKSPDEFDWEIVRIGAREGFLGMAVPSNYGGLYGYFMMRYGMLAVSAMIEELCRADSGIGLIFGAHGLGIAPILLSLDRSLWNKYFEPMEETWFSEKPQLAAFAITEPGAGSDAEDDVGAAKAKMGAFAKKVDGGWLLNGRKCFISNGGQASLTTVFAATDRENPAYSWTCFVVRSDQKGYSVGRLEHKMGQRAASAAELVFEDVFVSDDDVVGPVKGAWPLNRITLDASRSCVGAIALGIAQGAYDAAFKYCLETTRGGKLLVEHGWVRQELGEMAAKLEAARRLVYHASSFMPPDGMMSAMAKSYSSDVGMDVCARCVQLLGPEGIEQEHIVEKHFRDIKLCQIYEGTNQINRLRIMEDLESQYRGAIEPYGKYKFYEQLANR